MLDYIRIACAVPSVQVGNVRGNALDICGHIARADEENVDVLVLPELCLTGYTCADLFFQQTLLDAVKQELGNIVRCSADYPRITAVVGLPLSVDGKLYNCAAVVRDGAVQGIVPKTYLPNHKEFSERRWFASATALRRGHLNPAELGLQQTCPIPIGSNVGFLLGDGTKMAVEICEDLWAPIPISTAQALAGAEVVVNLAASNETVGKREYRRSLVLHQSTACSCIYAFCSAGAGESTQDMVFSGHCMVAQNGKLLAENGMLNVQKDWLVTDADLGIIRAARRENTTYRDASEAVDTGHISFVGENRYPLRSDGNLAPVRKNPFVPKDVGDLAKRCEAAFGIQVAGLKKRLQTIGAKPVIGISGGLDSTLALLVAAEAVRQLGWDKSAVHGVTMPCFGTSDRTYRNALELMGLLGVTAKEVNIRQAVTGHFRDIGHDPQVRNATYENAQARERTQVLMDYAGSIGGIVVGTGDLSELALGWCTYNGDHMSMYSVNASVPKTLIPHIIQYVASMPQYRAAEAVAQDIIQTPISPELLPSGADGGIAQCTEDIVGPYELHDFFLYHMLRNGFSPTKIYHLACRAHGDCYDRQTIKKWLLTFCCRFFSQQFKRNCQSDGVKIGSVCLNPRGDWQMPSDAVAAMWLEETENL